MAILEQCGGEIKDGLCRKCFNRSSSTSARCAQMYEVETKKPEVVPSCGEYFLKTPLQLGAMSTDELISYIDKLHNALKGYQVVIDFATNRDLKIS